ncbi:LPS export ABC transporter periplasmic protein LptC [Fulvimarina endophytica]|uniref:LPS export ABC transporter periplasmic protein LptC n=1 Tax=Fulvimarina endophytica TaxID=2293836 RepID=A0A371X1S7_9HYPH|nr:LPS export ABC transporter periplasmic protein LptC [Fulvimarina endophytica]
MGSAADHAGHSTTEDARQAREFASARRSGRRVKTLKIVLPVVGCLIVAAGIAITVVARAIPDGVRLSNASIQDGRVVMDDPRMSGVDANDRPFQLVAQKAMQAITGGAVDLEGINAKVSISDDASAVIRASAGHYDPEGQKLNLTGKLDVQTTDGMEIAMRSAAIDLDEGVLTSDEPLFIQTSRQEIRANALRLSDSGDKIRLSGGVSIVLKPDRAANGVEDPADDGLKEAAAIMNDPRLADAEPFSPGDQ